jgi:hypothetical protein
MLGTVLSSLSDDSKVALVVVIGAGLITWRIVDFIRQIKKGEDRHEQ